MFKVQVILSLMCLFFIFETAIAETNDRTIANRDRSRTRSNMPSHEEQCTDTLVDPAHRTYDSNSNRQIQSRQAQPAIQTVGTTPKVHNISEEMSLHLLRRAIENRDIANIKRLVEIVDVNNIYKGGIRPIHIASYYPIEILKVIIEAGANPNASDNFGNTPLHIVSSSLEKVRFLLRKQADPSAKNKQGGTPLHYAETAEVTEALIKAGAEINAKDNRGYTPLDYTVNQTIMEDLANEGREMEDDNIAAIAGDYLGNRFQLFFLHLSIALRNPAETSEWKTKINALVNEGATVTVKNPEVLNILDTLTNTRQL